MNKAYMKRAIGLAKIGWGKTNPNPLVGAVIVNKYGKIIGEGAHKEFGHCHAEVDALNNATEDVKGATMYVNLEPCAHHGQTPPCAQAIIDAGIKNIVISMVDPNPLVSGKGIKMLVDAGINVNLGVMKNEAKKLNEIFIKYITQKRPFVIMKSAMTFDGKICTKTGDSKWISSEESRNYVHVIRGRVAAVMVGVETIIKDNPLLTTRGNIGTDSIKLIFDTKGRIPIDSNVVTNAGNSNFINLDSNINNKIENFADTILVTTDQINLYKEDELIHKGVRILKCNVLNNRVNMADAMDKLYGLGIDSILLEGGGTLNSSAIEAGIVDKVMFFIAPKIVGGKDALTPVEGDGKENIENGFKLKDIEVQRYGEDILIEGYLSTDPQ